MFTAPAAPVESPAQRAAFFTSKAQSYAQQAQSAPFAFQRTEFAERAAKYLRFAAFALSTSEAQAAPVEVAPVAVEAKAEVAKVAPVSVVRDCRVRAMRRFWAICKAHGLDVRNAEAMTVALAGYLGCIIPSRSHLSSG